MKTDIKKSIKKTAVQVAQEIKEKRDAGKTVVTTNGCFDLIHAGHIQYLEESAALGDILIVGINSDASVKKLKGDDRPLQSEADRVKIMASLKMVDYSFIFEEDDPREFLKIIKPDLHVKGGDYTEDILERGVVEEGGGKIAILSFREGHSTTSIIEKMK